MTQYEQLAILCLLLFVSWLGFISCAGVCIVYTDSWVGTLSLFGCIAILGLILYLGEKVHTLQTQLQKPHNKHLGDSQ